MNSAISLNHAVQVCRICRECAYGADPGADPGADLRKSSCKPYVRLTASAILFVAGLFVCEWRHPHRLPEGLIDGGRAAQN
jgi:hypothetical protein